MKVSVLFSLIALCALSAQSVYGAAYPGEGVPQYSPVASPAIASQAKPIQLQAMDGTIIEVPRDVASQSEVIKNMFEDIEIAQKAQKATSVEADVLPLAIEKEDLAELVDMMTLTTKKHNQEINEKQYVEALGNKITEKFSDKEGRNKLNVMLDYLDIRNLKYDLKNNVRANMICKQLVAQNNAAFQDGDSELISALMISLGLPEDLQALVAKYWFLNYGNSGKRNFILPNLDYGFSIEELLAFNKLPAYQMEQIGDGSLRALRFDKLRINDLTGLNKIPDINSVGEIVLISNRLKTIRPDAFKGFNNLKILFLMYNPLETIQPGAFNGLNNLQTLYLSNIRFETIQPGMFNGLNNLQELDLGNNQFKTIEPGTFNGLNELRELRLHMCQLKTIQSGAFDGLNKLQMLVLYRNPLDQATLRMLQELKKQKPDMNMEMEIN